MSMHDGVDDAEQLLRRTRATMDGTLARLEPGEVFVTLSYAQSLDGSIASAAGRPIQLSNRESQRMTHAVRAMHDAILVGINTVLTDDPQLTVRLTQGKDPQPVIIDSRLRFPLEARLLASDCVQPIIMTGNDTCDEEKRRELEARGVRVWKIPQDPSGALDLAVVFERLGQDGYRTVMVEGGAEIIQSVLAARLAHQFLLTIAPVLIGGLRAVHADRQPTAAWPVLYNIDYACLDGDVIIRADLQPDAAAEESSSQRARSGSQTDSIESRAAGPACERFES